MRHRVVAVAVAVVTVAMLSAGGPDALAARPRAAEGEITERDVTSRLLPVVVGGAQVSGVVQGTQFYPQSVASGDPRPDSVVLWTRVVDPDLAGADLPVRVIVTKDRFFNKVVYNQMHVAEARYDHCLKLKVTGLEPRSSYLYFFVYAKGGVLYLSRLGTTKTAPAADDPVAARFAFFTCQDYEGKYYNVYARLLLDHRNDIDFVVFLGDYIYETSSQPGFQTPAEGRRIAFTDEAGAIRLGSGDDAYFAASSLSNYRQLYATYRSDPMLQQLHESFPMVAVWDDHEYANDCHGATATYFDKRKDETDIARRKRAEQAFFEYMPITPGLGPSGTLAIDDSVLYPNARIYQEFRYGANLDLVLTDFRSFRPEVALPEDTLPGRVLIGRPTLEAVLTPAGYQAMRDSFDPYLDLSVVPAVRAGCAAILTAGYQLANSWLTIAEAQQLAAAACGGEVSATFVNALFESAGMAAPFDATALAGMDRGLTALLLGKRDLYSSTGSRYVFVKDSFDLWAQYSDLTTGGASEDVYGATQETWLLSTLAGSTATWKVLGSSVSMTPMFVDFTNPLIAAMLPPGFPDSLRVRLLLDADEWDGFPDKRAEIVGFLRTLTNAVVISGDIHASFVADHGGVIEFTGTSVTSQTLADEVADMVAADPLLGGIPGIDGLLANLGLLLQVSAANPAVSPARIVWDDLQVHGGVVIEAGPDALTATYYHLPTSQTPTQYYGDPGALRTLFTTTSFQVENGTVTPLPH